MSILRFTSEGGRPDGERAQPEAELADLGVALVAGGGAPQRRVRLLPRLGLHPAPGHLPELAGELVLVVGPAPHDVADGLLPHAAALGRVDPEALELGPRRRAAGAEVDPALREQVEHGHRLRRPHRVVVGLGHEAHAVAEPDPLGAAPRWRRRAPRGSSSGSTPARSGARRSRRRPSRSGPRRWPAPGCCGRRRARCPRCQGRGTGIS